MSEILSSGGDREKTLTSEENDLLQRSNKKFKRQIDEVHQNMDMDIHSDGGLAPRKSYSQMTQSFDRAVNPLFEGGERDEDIISDEETDKDIREDDEDCPNIVLSRETKRRIRDPWKNAIIIKLFDRKMGYEVLMRRLRFKWQLKGNIALTDVGHSFYVVRFTSVEDYEFVMSQGPWMIGDSYLTIRKWIPNFIADEAPMRHLTAWVRIPNLSVEYFDKLVLHKIGSKIGKVIKIDRNTESMDRGQYVRFCIEVDLAKPLLSKFRLNGRIWKIQYEGLKMICYKCGHLGHKEDKCELFQPGNSGPVTEVHNVEAGTSKVAGEAKIGAANIRPEISKKYGEWMLVSKGSRRMHNKGSPGVNKQSEQPKKLSPPREEVQIPRGNESKVSAAKSAKSMEKPSGSRFAALEEMEIEGENRVRGREENTTMDASPGLDVTGTRPMNKAGVDNPEVRMDVETRGKSKMEEKIILETISDIEGNVGSGQDSAEDLGEISLDKISLLTKDNNLPKVASRSKFEPPPKPPHVQSPKFKKSSSRRPAILRSLGKENRPVDSKYPNKNLSEREQSQLQAQPDGRTRQHRDPHSVGVEHSTSGGDVCGKSDGGPVCDSGPSNGKSGENGGQFIHPTGEQCSVHDDVCRTTLHHRRADESIEGDVPKLAA